MHSELQWTCHLFYRQIGYTSCEKFNTRTGVKFIDAGFLLLSFSFSNPGQETLCVIVFRVKHMKRTVGVCQNVSCRVTWCKRSATFFTWHWVCLSQNHTINQHNLSYIIYIKPLKYGPQNTSWSPQEMRVLRQCKLPRAEVMFVIVQRENIRPSKKEINKAVTMLKLPDVCS
jgi:hypothetical protein